MCSNPSKALTDLQNRVNQLSNENNHFHQQFNQLQQKVDSLEESNRNLQDRMAEFNARTASNRSTVPKIGAESKEAYRLLERIMVDCQKVQECHIMMNGLVVNGFPECTTKLTVSQKGRGDNRYQ